MNRVTEYHNPERRNYKEGEEVVFYLNNPQQEFSGTIRGLATDSGFVQTWIVQLNDHFDDYPFSCVSLPQGMIKSK